MCVNSHKLINDLLSFNVSAVCELVGALGQQQLHGFVRALVAAMTVRENSKFHTCMLASK
jgi:hypothetical protein